MGVRLTIRTGIARRIAVAVTAISVIASCAGDPPANPSANTSAGFASQRSADSAALATRPPYHRLGEVDECSFHPQKQDEWCPGYLGEDFAQANPRTLATLIAFFERTQPW